MSISTAHHSNIASRASVSYHFLCVQCARLAIMAMAGRNRTPQILRLATGLAHARCVCRARVNIFEIKTNFKNMCCPDLSSPLCKVQ